MRVLSKQAFMSVEYKIENCAKNYLLLSFVWFLLFLSISAPILSVSSRELENNHRGRAIATNDRTVNDNYDLLPATSQPNWWQKRVDRRPTIVVNDEPMGTGVPTWKEVDIFGVDSRRGRSFSNAFKDESTSSAHRFASSLMIFTTFNTLLSLSIF